MKTIYILFILTILCSCNQPCNRKETIHRIDTESQIYWITSEITYKEGCATFKAWDRNDWYGQRTYTICGTFNQVY